MPLTHTLPFSALQAAVITRLGAHAETSALTFYAASSVPLDASFPYGTVQIIDSAPGGVFSKTGRQVEVALQYHTRSSAGRGDDADVFGGLDGMVQALTSSGLSVTGYTAQKATSPSAAGLIAEVQNGYTYRRGTARLRFHLIAS